MDAFERAINDSQILMFSGGFSAGDEPDGSAKFIASVFRNPERIMDAVHRLLTGDVMVWHLVSVMVSRLWSNWVWFRMVRSRPQTDDAPTSDNQQHWPSYFSKSVYTKVCNEPVPMAAGRQTLGGVYGSFRLLTVKDVLSQAMKWIESLVRQWSGCYKICGCAWQSYYG